MRVLARVCVRVLARVCVRARIRMCVLMCACVRARVDLYIGTAHP